MKFKYYLKGIGMGIIVTTIVLSVSFAMHEPNLSDAEIIERAKEIGMIMPESESNGGLFGSQDDSDTESEDESESERMTQTESQKDSELEAETDSEYEIESGTELESETESELESQTEAEGETQVQSETELVKPSETEVPAVTEEPSETEVPDVSEEPSESEELTTQVEITQYILHVVWGSTPRSIGEELLEVGMIEDVSDFRAYLKEQGYAGKIKSGDYTITKGMTYEEIAKIITKSE